MGPELEKKKGIECQEKRYISTSRARSVGAILQLAERLTQRARIHRHRFAAVFWQLRISLLEQTKTPDTAGENRGATQERVATNHKLSMTTVFTTARVAQRVFGSVYYFSVYGSPQSE